MSLSVVMTPIKEVKADLQFVVPVPFSQPCEPGVPGEGRMSPAVQHQVSVLSCCCYQWLWGCGGMCVCYGGRGRAVVIGASLLFHEGIMHSHNFKAVVIQRESLHRVKIKRALCASANTGIRVQGILWSKVVSSEQTRRSFEKCEWFQVFETKSCNGGKGCYFAELCKLKGGCNWLVNLTLLQASLAQLSRGQSHSHSSVHCRRKGKRWKKNKPQMFLRSSHFPSPAQQEECWRRC